MLAVDQAFISAFIGASFGLPIAHENLPYQPVAGTAYAELLNIPTDVTAYSLNSTDETTGLFRIVLRYPVNAGAVAAKTKADAISNVFKVGSTVSYNATGNPATSARVVGLQWQSGAPEDGWYKLVLTIRYRAFLRRN